MRGEVLSCPARFRCSGCGGGTACCRIADQRAGDSEAKHSAKRPPNRGTNTCAVAVLGANWFSRVVESSSLLRGRARSRQGGG